MEHIFKKWPRLCDLAADLSKPYQTVAAWKQRGSIPARYDLEIIRAAKTRGEIITLEELALARSETVQSVQEKLRDLEAECAGRDNSQPSDAA